MTTHPLATDPTVPDNIRAAFAGVTHQVVLSFDDGSETASNYRSAERAETARAEQARDIGRDFYNRGRTGFRRLVSVDVRPL